MKSVLRWCVVPLLATCLVAQTSMRSKPRKVAAQAVTMEDIQQLRDALAAQQRQIEQLQRQLAQRDQALQQAASAATEAQSKAADVSAQAMQQQDAETPHKDVADPKTSNTNVAETIQDTQSGLSAEGKEIKALGNLQFSGDLRLRYEPFFGGGPANGAASPDRHRERFRLRLNFRSKITDDFTAGFSFASGDLGDPIANNASETGFYTRKPIAISKAFGTYAPHHLKPFTLTIGKFGYTWRRTELIWDNDLNPEGASEQLSWNWKNKLLTHFAIIGYETPIFEAGGGADTYMTGGQVQTGWSLGPGVKFTADAAYYDFNNADTIAQNQAQNPSNGFATEGISNFGGGNFGFSAAFLTNNFGVINNKRAFASKFGIFDAIARLDFDTGNTRWPIYALFDFAQNTQACANLKAFVAAGATLPTCDPRQRHGYWSELKFGQTKNKGDLLLGYTFARIERDAVLSAFNFSNLRQPTNVIEHRIEAYYQAYPHVQMGATGLIGRQIVTAQSPTLERWLKRWQFDTIFSF
jgi:type II secretory pathway component PulJ